MKKFTGIQDVSNLNKLIQEALALKENPFKHKELGKNKTLGLVFMNPSFRTRLSTQKAAQNLGLDVMILNLNQESWKLETQDGAIMNSDTVEHIKDAAAILGSYCDIVGIRCFPDLKSQKEDDSEPILSQFLKYCKCPIISLESATLHPLQSFADLLTIKETAKGSTEGNSVAKRKAKVVLTWAPHVKALPQAVANSFSEWMSQADVEFVIAHPENYTLNEQFTQGATICTKQDEALKDADFVYVKNWSSYEKYGQIPLVEDDWLLNEKKMKLTNKAKIMHCLPVRRNVELSDELLDGEDSLVLQQAENRVYAAQAVLKQILETNF